MSKLSAAALIPLLVKLGDYFKTGVDHYADLKAAGVSVSPEMLSAFINARMEQWDPKVSGKSVLDSSTREAASRLLAGLIINLTALNA